MSIVCRDARITLGSYPFNHMVIENVFPAALASNLGLLFKELITQAKPIGKVGEVGELKYDALNFTPMLSHVQQTSIAAFVSTEFREFTASSFSIRLDENVMIGMHRHNAPSKPGWPHTDFAVVSFPNIAPNYQGMRLFQAGCQCNYSDDTRDRQPQAIKTARAVACLYYCANPPWQPGAGGETGLYAELGKRLVQRIPPTNNSLLIFEVSPVSYHAYLGSRLAQRNAYVWWYHASPNYLLARYQSHVAFKQSLDMDPWDRWTDKSIAKFQTSTELQKVP
ncbi:2OG-Fe(II) oxygenase family protein [Aureliella helgolandensis]|uniref:Prolyl 3,4-dihydroxylase TPA1/OFD1 N-terminal domain-containing protein n=1 Tax=Aureliella helgolandensis TaxID=2527968 RepID=A0A518G4L0_9BACT|nr:2OG-Fe(II) oxygenase [Aureliella helgolandensis]QDV23536.1 hypothetical protein Q31a_18370 [Aureliella helgolandensis]